MSHCLMRPKDNNWRLVMPPILIHYLNLITVKTACPYRGASKKDFIFKQRRQFITVLFAQKVR